MPPGEEPVQVPDLVVEGVVLLGADGDDGVRRLGADRLGELVDPPGAERLAVRHAEVEQPARGLPVDVDRGDEEGPEIVPLAALVHADARLGDGRVEQLLVAERHLLEHRGLEVELYEFARALSLDEELAVRERGDAHAVLGGRETGVGDVRAYRVAARGEIAADLGGLPLVHAGDVRRLGTFGEHEDGRCRGAGSNGQDVDFIRRSTGTSVSGRRPPAARPRIPPRATPSATRR